LVAPLASERREERNQRSSLVKRGIPLNGSSKRGGKARRRATLQGDAGRLRHIQAQKSRNFKIRLRNSIL